MPLPSRPRRLSFFRNFRADRRGVSAVEAAIILPVFLVFLLALFEVAYDQFVQGILESALQITAYQVQVGNTENATDGADGPTFISKVVCPSAIAGLLNCNGIYVRVQQFNTTACSDFYSAVNGSLPITGNKSTGFQLQLGYFVSEQGPSNDSQVGPANCETTATNAGVGFCNPGPNEYIIMTAIYLTPSFIYSLLPGQGYTHGGSFVHAAFATSAFYTENFSPPATPISPC
jgi:hypothetical protein